MPKVVPLLAFPLSLLLIFLLPLKKDIIFSFSGDRTGERRIEETEREGGASLQSAFPLLLFLLALVAKLVGFVSLVVAQASSLLLSLSLSNLMETSKEGSGQERKKERRGKGKLWRVHSVSKVGEERVFLYKTGKAMVEEEIKTSASADCRAMQLPPTLSRYLARQTFLQDKKAVFSLGKRFFSVQGRLTSSRKC